MTWESHLRPSTAHSVTTVVIGNCGVDFAPCRADDRERLFRLMEGVEDIPHPVLTEGLPWTWETFPEYLDTIAGRHFDADVAALIPHAALRVHVMGARGEAREPATAEDRARMADLVREGIAAGAMGFGTPRTMFHKSSDGNLVPTLTAGEDELQALADALADAGEGILQFVSDFADEDAEFDMLYRIGRRSGRPITFPLTGIPGDPTRHHLFSRVRAANEEGQNIRVQALGRATDALLSHQLTLHPFCTSSQYRALAGLPFADRISRLGHPDIKATILAEPFIPDPANAMSAFVRDFDRVFLLSDDPNYEPNPDDSVASRAGGGCDTRSPRLRLAAGERRGANALPDDFQLRRGQS